MKFTRRQALYGASGMAGFALLPVLLRRPRRSPASGLTTDPASVLHTKPGFRYEIISRTDTAMNDGFVMPARPDGMAVFVRDEGLVLMRNHENTFGDRKDSAYPSGPIPREAYDAEAFGGVTRTVLDPKTYAPRSHNLVLTGTTRNCACGPSPKGFLTCEEDTSAGHGFVFLCDPSAQNVSAPARIDALGRFQHEAALTDPTTGITYLTEDRHDGCFYRFVPRDPASPFEGRLEALSAETRLFETSNAMREGETIAIGWVPVDDATPSEDVVRRNAQRSGAAVVRRGEGIVRAPDGSIYFTATTGGKDHAGQIFRLRPEANELTSVYESDTASVDMPDNLTVTRSGVIIVAEDGAGPNGVRALLPDGQVVVLAENATSGEITGVCLSPDEDALFLNLQVQGITLALHGPFGALG